MLSKPIIPFGTSLKKSKKRQAIASASSEALGNCRLAEGSSGSSWEVLGELGKLQGSSQRFNIEKTKTPDQPHSGRYVTTSCSFIPTPFRFRYVEPNII